MNGEKIKEKETPSKLHINEQAATTEEDYAENRKKSFFIHPVLNKMKRNTNTYKNLIIAIVTAIMIGSIFGFVMLSIFGSVNSETTKSASNPTVSLKSESKENPGAVNDGETIPALTAFILQNGVFTDKTNAESMLAELKSNNIKAMIWENEKEYIVMMGMDPTYDGALEQVKGFKKKKVDIFIKEWETPSIALELSSEELTWLASFQKLLSTSIEDLGEEKVPVSDEWGKLAKTKPDKMSKHNDLFDSVQLMAEKTMNYEEASLQLLTIWYEFDQLLKDIS